jgi:hypothetical protein
MSTTCFASCFSRSRSSSAAASATKLSSAGTDSRMVSCCHFAESRTVVDCQLSLLQVRCAHSSKVAMPYFIAPPHWDDHLK